MIAQDFFVLALYGLLTAITLRLILTDRKLRSKRK